VQGLDIFLLNSHLNFINLIKMSNEAILRAIFSESLAISTEEVIDSLEYNTIPKWDSLGHMSIVAKIEDTFNIMLDTDDILDMNSFGKAKEILSKYDIEF